MTDIWYTTTKVHKIMNRIKNANFIISAVHTDTVKRDSGLEVGVHNNICGDMEYFVNHIMTWVNLNTVESW